MSSNFLKIGVLLQKYRAPVMMVSCGGLFAANMFYHTFPDLSFRQLYQAWYKGEPVSLSDKLQGLFRQVLEDYGVRSPARYSCFASFGFHPVAAGAAWLPAGAHVGLPANFNSTAQDAGGITNRSVFINGQAVAWDSEAGCVLRDSLVLSPAAQKFAVAREVARLDIGGPVVSAVVAPVCLGGVWVYSVVLKQMLGLHGRPALVRGVANLAALGLGAVTYLLTADTVSQWVDYGSDRRAAAVSPDYARGGVEFYNKLLSRNRTLRVLMGQKGEEMYAVNGNLFPAHLLKLKHAPYTSRRDGLLSMLKNTT
ncbi:transmembrane protein 177 [Gadus macrocephalus]|uniref:transmembrane protein 177 n=1 Tax=Gadus macrocephalus TaxID=80720 RepID=UPI0028CBB021|nr:transmembrane protein 177 [Gadus macrocephalus]